MERDGGTAVFAACLSVSGVKADAIPVVVVTGTIGAGKSTVAAAMSELLHEQGSRHGLIEVDWLGEVYPPPDPTNPYSTDLAMKVLSSVWPHYMGAGITRAIVTMTLENHDELRDLLLAMGSPPATVVRLTAAHATRQERIKAREFGNLRDLFLHKTADIDRKQECLEIGDLVVENDERLPHATAAEILQRLGWTY